jgi:hypothetical protein
VLNTGEEIKLQRNALAILQNPTGDEPVSTIFKMARRRPRKRPQAGRRALAPLTQDFSEEEEEEQQPAAVPAPPAPQPQQPQLSQGKTRQAAQQAVEAEEDAEGGARPQAGRGGRRWLPERP